MSIQKDIELGRDAQRTAWDFALDDCEAEARLLDRRLARDVNVSNEQRAQLVADCFCDYADALDVPGAYAAWLDRFGELAGWGG
jgi:hypothetical protein